MTVRDFFRNSDNLLFAVQYAGEVSVEGNELVATLINIYILAAKDLEEAQVLAEKYLNIGGNQYHNRPDGDLVTWKPIGIHSIEEIQFTYNEHLLPVDNFLFSKLTTIEDLVSQRWPRNDLPPTDE